MYFEILNAYLDENVILDALVIGRVSSVNFDSRVYH